MHCTLEEYVLFMFTNAVIVIILVITTNKKQISKMFHAYTNVIIVFILVPTSCHCMIYCPLFLIRFMCLTFFLFVTFRDQIEEVGGREREFARPGEFCHFMLFK